MTHLWAQIKDSTFVREFAADSSSLQYIVVSQKQLMDLDTFCTHPIRFSVFSIDSTFNIGNSIGALRILEWSMRQESTNVSTQ